MFSTLRNRLIAIGVLVAAAIFALIPRDVTVRERGADGTMRDTTIRRVPISLGLDLQGGTHLALELDQSKQVSADPKRDIDLALTVLRKRIDEFGVTEPVVQKEGDDRIVVELAGIKDPARARAIVQRNAFLEFRITDETGALEKSLPAMDRALARLGIKGGTGAKASTSAVTALLGGDSAQKADSGKAGADSAAADTSSAILTGLIQPSGNMPGEYLVEETAFPRVDSLINLAEVKRELPRGVVLRWSNAPESVGVQAYRFLYALEDRSLVTGQSLEDAVAQPDPLTGGPVVAFTLDRAGGRKFGEGTGRHIGDYMAILLDDRVQGRPPVIQSRIDRRGQITLTGRTITEAQDLALTLKAGALPIPLKVVEERQVGPSLGSDSIKGGVLAGLVGTGLVVLIMLGYYAFSGFLAVLALVLYGLFTLAGLAGLGATLSLPGLAGLILSVGIAVDANVLIFERIREELDGGKTVRLAIDQGFEHALPAIIDSSLSTVLTALFLFEFGTGPVQGFAVTLILGLFASLLTAIFVTRTFYLLWLQRNPSATTLSVGSLRFFRGASYDFIAYRKVAFGLTGVVAAIGLVATLVRGLDYSVEFTGGTLLHIKGAPTLDAGQIRTGLEANGIRGPEVQGFGAPGEFVVRARLAAEGQDLNDTEKTAGAVKAALDKAIGAGTYSVERAEAVGPKVGGELRTQAFLAVFLSFFAVLAYLAYRFEWRFGLAAVIATAHDIVLTILFIGTLKLEISLVVVAGVLTMVGYSLNDTIIIFDRVRENLKKRNRGDFAGILNESINETLPRSVLTHGTTLCTLLALAIFGGEVIRPFALVMFFGVFTGTFSSIYIASPVLLMIENKWPGAVAKTVRGAASRPAAPARGRAQPAS